jgi:hypothetical protein
VKIGTGITVTSALSTGFSCKCCTWTCPENPRPVNPCNSQNSYAHPVQIIFHDNKLYIYILIYLFIHLFAYLIYLQNVLAPGLFSFLFAAFCLQDLARYFLQFYLCFT